MTLAPEVNKINLRSLGLTAFWPWLWKSTKSVPEVVIQWFRDLGPRSQQNQTQKSRINAFLGLAPEVDKSVAEVSIWWFSGLGSGSRQNYAQKSRCDSFLALAPEIDKISTRSLNLMTLWPWLSKSRFNDQRASKPASSIQPANKPASQPASPPQPAQAAQPSPGNQPSSAINHWICIDFCETVNKCLFSDAKNLEHHMFLKIFLPKWWETFNKKYETYKES